MLREISSVNPTFKNRVSFVKEKKYPKTLVEDGKADFITKIRIGTTAKGFYRGWVERSGSTPKG